jgi:hypothetical protein
MGPHGKLLSFGYSPGSHHSSEVAIIGLCPFIIARRSRNQNASVNDQRSAFSFKPPQNCHAFCIPNKLAGKPSVKHSDRYRLSTTVVSDMLFSLAHEGTKSQSDRSLSPRHRCRKQFQATGDEQATRDHFEKLVLVGAVVEGLTKRLDFSKFGQMLSGYRNYPVL